MLVVAAHDELSVRITLLRSLYCLHPPQKSQDPPLPELGLSGFEFLRARRPLAVVLLVGRLVVFELLSVRPAGQVRIVELVLSDIFTRLVGV
jgi:hypothetical protein